MTPRLTRSSAVAAPLPFSINADMETPLGWVVAMGGMLIERRCKDIGRMANILCMTANSTPALAVADLPLILALSRERTLAGAAEKLDVDLSTVFRRLNALEQRLR